MWGAGGKIHTEGSVNLKVDKAWRDDETVAINLYIRPRLEFVEHLFWTEDKPAFRPHIHGARLLQPPITIQTTVNELDDDLAFAAKQVPTFRIRYRNSLRHWSVCD